jgi:hypothetical protein
VEGNSIDEESSMQPNKMRFLILALLILSTLTTQAQDDPCGARNLNRQIDALYNTFLSQRSEVDSEATLSAALNFTMAVDEILGQCGVATGSGDDEVLDPGIGTLEDPYGFLQAGSAGDGVTIRVTEILRPADDLLQREAGLPSQPAATEQYVLIYVEVLCEAGRREDCKLDGTKFRLTGDSGTLYDPVLPYYSGFLDTSLLPGRQRAGAYPFLIASSDTNLRLLYYSESIFGNAAPVYYRAQNTIDITTTAELRVRTGPGVNYPVLSALPEGATSVALGRNEDGTWIQLPEGWVFIDYIIAGGDLLTLPIVEPEE